MSCDCTTECGCETPLEDMNPGIRSTVNWLRSHGFKTTNSGDGVTHECECDLPVPYVHIKCAPEQLASETDRLVALLEAAGINFDDCPHPQEDPEGAQRHPDVEACYLPLQERDGFISIFNVIIPEAGGAK